MEKIFRDLAHLSMRTVMVNIITPGIVILVISLVHTCHDHASEQITVAEVSRLFEEK